MTDKLRVAISKIENRLLKTGLETLDGFELVKEVVDYPTPKCFFNEVVSFFDEAFDEAFIETGLTSITLIGKDKNLIVEEISYRS